MRKMMMLAMVSLLVGSGCASLNPTTPFKGKQIFIDTATGQEYVCKYPFWQQGQFHGLIYSNIEFNECIRGYEDRGFVKKAKGGVK